MRQVLVTKKEMIGFWQAAYIAVLRSGSNRDPKDLADEAVTDLHDSMEHGMIGELEG